MADREEVKKYLDDVLATFQPDNVAGVSMVMQYEITGEGGGTWHMQIADCKCDLIEGEHPSPDMRTIMKADDWIDMNTGALGGMKAWITGKMKYKGDMRIARRMDKEKWFAYELPMSVGSAFKKTK